MALEDNETAGANRHHGDIAQPREDGEMSIAELMRWVWRNLAYPVAGVVIALLIVGVYLTAQKIREYEKYSEYVIQFRFEGRIDDRYPNGTPFSLGDIIAPAVLSVVYREQKIADYGISFADFQTAVTVAPYTPDRRLIIDRYSQIDARRATTAELREAQSSLERELATASSRYAALRYSQKTATLPEATISKVLIDIAREWERVSIETRGVLAVDIATVSPSVFSDDSVDGLERLNALRVIRENLEALQYFIHQMSNRPGGNRLRDSETEATLASLRANVESASLQLAEIPANWPTAPEATRNDILGLPINLYSGSLFSPAEFENLDYLIALDLLQQRVRLVRENVTRIMDREFGSITQDPKTGLTAGDLDRLLTDLDEFTIKQLTAPVLTLGIAKNPQVVRLYYGARLQELKRQRQTLANKAAVLEGANQSYQGLKSGSSVSVQPSTGAAGAGFPPGSATVIPQFGDAFLDRIISMSQQGNDAEFRQTLLKETVALQQEAAEVESEVERVNEYLNRFGQSGDADSFPASARGDFVKTIDRELPRALAKLKEYSEVTQRIAYRLRFAEDIFSVTNPGEGSGIRVDYYLRDAAAASAQVSVPQILSTLRGYTEIANRLYQDLSAQALGSYQKLFAASSDPRVMQPRLLTRFDYILIALSIGLGLLVGLGLAIVRQIVQPRRAAGQDA